LKSPAFVFCCECADGFVMEQYLGTSGRQEGDEGRDGGS